MQIDQDYIKTILNTFIESPRSFIWIGAIEERGIAIDDKFLFHMQILEDQEFIECLDKMSDLGYEIKIGGQFEWKSRPLRLTAAGHEFVDAINRAEIWDVLQAEFKDASLSTLKSAAKSLLLAFARKQLSRYLDI